MAAVLDFEFFSYSMTQPFVIKFLDVCSTFSPEYVLSSRFFFSHRNKELEWTIIIIDDYLDYICDKVGAFGEWKCPLLLLCSLFAVFLTSIPSHVLHSCGRFLNSCLSNKCKKTWGQIKVPYARHYNPLLNTNHT